MEKTCFLEPNDTVDSVYSRFMNPESTKLLVESVDLI